MSSAATCDGSQLWDDGFVIAFFLKFVVYEIVHRDIEKKDYVLCYL